MKKIILLFSIILVLISVHSYSRMQNPVSIPVLCYHHISTDNNSTFSRSSYAVTKKQFELQMNYLKDNGYKTITLNTLIDFIRNKPVELPEKPVVITFDDGLKSQLHTAYPILKKHGFRAVFFIYPSVIISRSRNIRKWHMTREMINVLHDAGNEIESHSYYHPLMHRETDAINRFQFKNSKNWLEKLTGKKITYFAYPFGSYTQSVIRIGREEGYKGMFTINLGTVAAGTNPYSINRIMITRNHNIKTFAGYIRSLPLKFRSINPVDGGVQNQLQKVTAKLAETHKKADYRMQVLFNGNPVRNAAFDESLQEITFYPRRVLNGLNNVQIMLFPRNRNNPARIGSWTFVVRNEGMSITRRKVRQNANRANR